MVGVLSVLFFVGLVAMGAARVLMLRRRGVKAFLFGATNASDFLLLPAVLCFAYAVLAGAFGLPLPGFLKYRFTDYAPLTWLGLGLCLAALGWFVAALASFGNSFRVGIDEKKPDKLVTTGLFAVSRNPVYVGFLLFFLGEFLVYPGWLALAAFALFFAAIHRQVLREEKFLRGHYGADYVAYCAKTRRYL